MTELVLTNRGNISSEAVDLHYTQESQVVNYFLVK